MTKAKTPTIALASTAPLAPATVSPICGPGLTARLLACAIKTGPKGGWTYRELAELEQRGAAVLRSVGYERTPSDRFHWPRLGGTKTLSVLDALREYSEWSERVLPLAPPLAA